MMKQTQFIACETLIPSSQLWISTTDL